MCGFVTIFDPYARHESMADQLQCMCDVMVSRGPDHYGVHEDAAIHMGHRRLSIIDLSDKAHQPMQKGDWVLVYNGEIYNYREIRSELETSGVVFDTQSDTEVIIEAYRRWGSASVQKFNGMFAFTLWNRQDQSLFVARDRLGVKPLFFGREGHRWVFASDIKAIWEYITPSRRIDSAAVQNFLSQMYIAQPASSTHGISKFQPAHWLRLQGHHEEWGRYWDLNHVKKQTIDFSQAVEQTEALLRDAIRLRLRSDVPVGCFLSGGVDSSLVTSLTAQEGLSQFHTYSIGFDMPQFDESSFSTRVARRWGTRHEHIRLTAESLAVLPAMVWHYSDLFGDSSAIPSYFVAQAARRGLKVVLTGDGADEGFGGYVDPFAVYLHRRYLHGLPAILQKAMTPLTRVHRRLEKFCRLASSDVEALYLGFHTSGWARYQSNGLRCEALHACRSRDPVDQLLYADIIDRLCDDFLVKVDMATMAHSIEARSPFLDYRLIELGYSLAHPTRFHRWRRKAVLKRIAQRYIDRDIVQRRKMGFTMPLAAWLSHPRWAKSVAAIIRRPSMLRDYISEEMQELVITEFFSGRREHATRLWLLLWFQVWEGLFVSKIYRPQQSLSELAA